MKSTSSVVLLVFLLCTTVGLAESPAQKSFDALKGLAGEWVGKDSLEHPVQIRFRVTSGGSALLSELVEPSRKEDMITVFHLDGNRLLLTHYCAEGNQPRMKATASPDGKTIIFDFVDATNLVPPKVGHMRRLVIRMPNPNHHTEEWTFVENGKESKDLFDVHRTKS